MRTATRVVSLLALCVALPSWGATSSRESLVAQVNQSAQGKAGFAAYRKHDYATALKDLWPLAQWGSAKADAYLGLMYLQGEGVQQNTRQALSLFQSSGLGPFSKNAYTAAGFLYQSGVFIPRNFAEAAKWYRRAAKQGDPAGQERLGYLYANGEGVPRNYERAYWWWRNASGKQYVVAEYELGHLIENGEGLPRTQRNYYYESAAKWYIRAAEQGNTQAEYALARLYAFGKGEPKDYVIAYALANVAAATSDLEYSAVASRLRGNLESKMSSPAVSEAQALSVRMAADPAHISEIIDKYGSKAH